MASNPEERLSLLIFTTKLQPWWAPEDILKSKCQRESDSSEVTLTQVLKQHPSTFGLKISKPALETMTLLTTYHCSKLYLGKGRSLKPTLPQSKLPGGMTGREGKMAGVERRAEGSQCVRTKSKRNRRKFQDLRKTPMGQAEWHTRDPGIQKTEAGGFRAHTRVHARAH